MTHFDFRQCSSEHCRFRFPVAEHEPWAAICPLCGADTFIAAQATRDREAAVQAGRAVLPFVALLDNVRSVFNVGSIFRSADAAGVGHLYLCGVTPTPNHPRLAKTALGSQASVPWTHCNNSLDATAILKAAGWALWALEEGPGATPISQIETPPDRLALVVGGEVAGVDPGLLVLCERMVQIPMRGTKRSLNVAVAFGVAAVLLGEKMVGRRA
jgi:tRNA G18 (ribose-2'-O)-methylase SpoU